MLAGSLVGEEEDDSSKSCLDCHNDIFHGRTEHIGINCHSIHHHLILDTSSHTFGAMVTL